MTWVVPEQPLPPDPERGPDPNTKLPADSLPDTDPAYSADPTPEITAAVLPLDEPPVDDLADTNPSLTIQPVSVPPDEGLEEVETYDEVPMWRRVVGMGVLLLAAALTLLAGMMIALPRLRDAAEPGATAPAAASVGLALPTAESAAGVSAPRPSGPSLPAEPTLSPDQIAALLANPPVMQPAAGEPVQREDSPFTIQPERSRGEVITYTIQSGDTITAIADRFGLQKDTIAWSNDRDTVFSLRPGNLLYIMPVDGVYHLVLADQTIQEIADRYDVDPYAIISSEYNNLFGASPQMVLSSGTRVIVPGGTSTYNDWTYNPVVERSGDGGGGADGAFISFAPGQPGSCGRQPNPGGTGYFSNPLGSYTWVRGFDGFHTGVDLSASVGAPVYAASPGRVIYRGWNDWGYGYLVVLAHGPFTSFYGHLSAINVACGQMVGAGTQIGAVGNTGNSSGPHLHFEIRYNDNPTDPTAYTPF